MRIPAWAWLPIAAYCLLLVGEISRASSWAEVILALAAGLLGVPLGAAIVFGAVRFWLYDQIILLIRGVRVTATIEGYIRSNPSSDARYDTRYATYRYRPLNSDQVTNTSSIGVLFERAVGTEVMVRYDPKRPQRVAGLRFPVCRTLVGLILAALGTLLVVGSQMAGK
jgi:hypothetical protein